MVVLLTQPKIILMHSYQKTKANKSLSIHSSSSSNVVHIVPSDKMFSNEVLSLLQRTEKNSLKRPSEESFLVLIMSMV